LIHRYDHLLINIAKMVSSMIERHNIHALELAVCKIHGPEGAAELLQVNPNTLRGKMRKLGIPFKK